MNQIALYTRSIIFLFPLLGSLVIILLTGFRSEGDCRAGNEGACISASIKAINAQAMNTQNVELIGQIGGVVDAFAVQGSYAYVGVGPRLLVLEITTPTTPTVVGQTLPFPGDLVNNVVVRDQSAYISVRGGAFHIINIADPRHPTPVTHYDAGDSISSMVVSGTLAYLAAEESGLQIINLPPPTSPSTSPTLVGSFMPPLFNSNLARTVAINGNIVYLCSSGRLDRLYFLDVSNPAQPQKLGEFPDLAWPAAGIASQNDLVFVTNSSGVTVLTVADPSKPTEIGHYQLPGYYSAGQIEVEGQRAYVAMYSDQQPGFQVLDISDPTKPTEIKRHPVSQTIVGFSRVGERLYTAHLSGGFRLFAFPNADALQEIGTYDPIDGDKVDVVGDRAYLITLDGNVAILDVRQPVTPTLLGQYSAPSEQLGGKMVTSMAVSNTTSNIVPNSLLYVSQSNGLYVVDVSEPSQAHIIASNLMVRDALATTISGSYLYLTNGYVGNWPINFMVVDVSNPLSPTLIGQLNTPESGWDVAVVDRYAYLADWNALNRGGHLRVIDVNNPFSPTEVGTLDVTPGEPQGIVVRGDFAYLAANERGLRVIDIRTPTAPVEVGSYQQVKYLRAVANEADRLYLADGGNGLQVLDVSTPSAPRPIGFYSENRTGFDLDAGAGHVYMANGESGLYILRYVTPTPTPDPPGNTYLPMVKR